MALKFPSNPALNDIYEVSPQRIYIFNGARWVIYRNNITQSVVDAHALKNHTHTKDSLSGVVKSINSSAPDAQGNVTINVTQKLVGSWSGTALKATSDGARWYPNKACQLLRAYLTIGTVSTVDTVIDIKKNSISVGTVTLTAGSYRSGDLSLGNLDVSVTDYLTTAISSATGGYDLTLVIEYVEV